MQKDRQEKNLKVKVQKALNEEADKAMDEMSVERIEIFVKILNTYDKAESDISDYETFLETFNLKYGIKFKNSRKKKHRELNVNC